MPRKKVVAEEISARREHLRAEHAEAVREKISTTVLTERLQSYALGKVKMTAGQVKAAEILLGKTLPSLANVKHEVDPVQVTFLISDTPTPQETPSGS